MWRKSLLVGLLVMLIGVVAVVSPTSAQGPPPGKGVPNYDPATEVTVQGTIQEVKLLTMPGGQGGTHLVLATNDGMLEVLLGPTAFLKQIGLDPGKGDRIEVTGSKMKYDGADALIAREVKVGDKSITLRNAQGVPAWSGGGRK